MKNTIDNEREMCHHHKCVQTLKFHVILPMAVPARDFVHYSLSHCNALRQNGVYMYDGIVDNVV